MVNFSLICAWVSPLGILGHNWWEWEIWGNYVLGPKIREDHCTQQSFITKSLSKSHLSWKHWFFHSFWVATDLIRCPRVLWKNFGLPRVHRGCPRGSHRVLNLCSQREQITVLNLISKFAIFAQFGPSLAQIWPSLVHLTYFVTIMLYKWTFSGPVSSKSQVKGWFYT